MKPDTERSDEFWKGIDEIPKRNRYGSDYADEEPAEPGTVMHITDGEEEEECPSCKEPDHMHENEYREWVKKHAMDGEEFEMSDGDRKARQFKYHEETRRSLKNRELLKKGMAHHMEPVGEERPFEIEYSWAYDNVQGNRHSKTQTEYAVCEDAPVSVNDAQTLIHDRVMSKYPNCEITSIRPMREEWK